MVSLIPLVMVLHSSLLLIQPFLMVIQSNLLGAADLSEATLETALTTAIQKTKDDRGILIGASVLVSLHIPVDYWAVADKILSSPGNTGTSAAVPTPTRMLSMQFVTWVWSLKATTLTVASLILMRGLLRLMCRMERRCLSVLRFRLKWSLTLILAIFDSKPVSVIASVSLIGVGFGSAG